MNFERFEMIENDECIHACLCCVHICMCEWVKASDESNWLFMRLLEHPSTPTHTLTRTHLLSLRFAKTNIKLTAAAVGKGPRRTSTTPCQADCCSDTLGEDRESTKEEKETKKKKTLIKNLVFWNPCGNNWARSEIFPVPALFYMSLSFYNSQS